MNFLLPLGNPFTVGFLFLLPDNETMYCELGTISSRASYGGIEFEVDGNG